MPSLSEHVARNPAALLPHQRELLRSKASVIIIHGGVGAAKTRACLWKMYLHARARAGVRMIACALTYRQMKDVLLDPFLEEFPADTIDFNVSNYEITIKCLDGSGNSKIIFRSLDRADKIARIKGQTITGYYVSQAEQIPEEAWEMLEQRVRDVPSGLALKIMDANADSTKHWLYRHYLDSNSRSYIGNFDTHIIHVTSFDNPGAYSEEHYRTARKALRPAVFNRMYLGIWGLIEGLVYSRIPNAPVPKSEQVHAWFLGLDPGRGEHPFGIILLALTKDRKWIVSAERQFKPLDWSANEISSIIDSLGKPFGGEKTYAGSAIDWADSAYASALVKALPWLGNGLGIGKPGDRARFHALNRSIDYVAEEFKQSRLFVAPECSGVLNQAAQYGIDPDTGLPYARSHSKGIDPHLLDALRYAAIRFHRHRATFEEGLP